MYVLCVLYVAEEARKVKELQEKFDDESKKRLDLLETSVQTGTYVSVCVCTSSNGTYTYMYMYMYNRASCKGHLFNKDTSTRPEVNKVLVF